VLLAAALSFPIAGLESKQQNSGPAETYYGIWNKKDTWTNNYWSDGKLLGKSLIAAVD
jgi:hypothetical protein